MIKIIKLLVALFIGIFVCISVLFVGSSLAEPEAISSDFISEYPIPTITKGEPFNIVVESTGRVWFTLPMSNAIGSLVVTTTMDYKFTFYDVPTVDSEPYDLVYDGQAIWFTERAGNKIGRLDMATKTLTETAVITTTNVSPTGIAIAPEGDLWFTERDSNRLGRFEPVSSTFFEYETPAELNQGGDLEDIDVTTDAVWFTAPGVDKVVKFEPSTGRFIQIVVNDPLVPSWPPGNLVLDNSGKPWITSPTNDRIGSYLGGTLAFWTWYNLPTSGGEPTGITYTSSEGINYIWFVETEADRVGQMAVGSNGKLIHIWQQFLPTTGSRPKGIAVDASGNAWITESGQNKIAQWSPPYFYFVNLPITLKN